jgi:predicted PurR-regulated permease PerM
MTPKKAIIIIFIIFFAVIAAFAFLYLNKNGSGLTNNLINFVPEAGQNLPAAADEPLKTSELIQQKIDKIVEDAGKNPSQNTPAKVRQEVIGAINAEIIKQEQNQTPEQEAADLKVQAARQKAIDQINSQIKKKVNPAK